ncbi:hypothetical protein GCM10023346_31430 [Arthrobacter gyeryongensis]|uniref:PucR C-terminal helix-turn-helix domain-containing protein n=2 Tax=Arthrobacter gyeryongensis TaxID=1650592 RepID=A0ABP9SJ03_9MICC
MAEARAMLRLGHGLRARDTVLRVQSLALENLLSTAGDRDALRRFVDQQIGPLLEADTAKQSQLTRTLATLLECGGNKAAAAERLHLRRQSLYYRLEQISRLIEVDLDDPAELTTLAVALRAHRMLGAQ